MRYWDGAAWTEQVAPAGQRDELPPDPSKGACPYCQTPIAPNLSRCPQCSGIFKFCRKCNHMVAVTTNSKFVGMARGGTKTQVRCGTCQTVLEGPRF